MPPAPDTATYADVLAAPEPVVAELVDGKLPSPPPELANTPVAAATALAAELGRPPFPRGKGGPRLEHPA